MGCTRPRVRSICEAAAFQAVYRRGKAVRRRSIGLRYLARPGEPLRLGVTIPKRVGKAVTRNKLRRRIREHARLRQWDLREVDVVVDCRPGVGELSGPALLEELDGLWLEMRRRLA
jgi:ribonuclease P protein component